MFEITGFRLQMTQEDDAAQEFALEIYADDGSGNAPTSGFTPLFTFPETTQTLLGSGGFTSSLYEIEFSTPGLILDADTVYWLSGYGTDAVANATAINNFFTVADGAASTTANGVFIGPFFGYADWQPAENVTTIPEPVAFSFAVDGACEATPVTEVPVQSRHGIAVLVGLLAALGLWTLARRG